MKPKQNILKNSVDSQNIYIFVALVWLGILQETGPVNLLLFENKTL